MPTLSVDEFYAEVGNLIKAERLKNGMSQEVLGEGIGLTRASVINLEKGRHKPSLYLLLAIAELLRIPHDNLIPGEKVSKKSGKEVSKKLSDVISDQGKAPDKKVMDFLTSIMKQ